MGIESNTFGRFETSSEGLEGQIAEQEQEMLDQAEEIAAELESLDPNAIDQETINDIKERLTAAYQGVMTTIGMTGVASTVMYYASETAGRSGITAAATTAVLGALFTLFPVMTAIDEKRNLKQAQAGDGKEVGT